MLVDVHEGEDSFENQFTFTGSQAGELPDTTPDELSAGDADSDL